MLALIMIFKLLSLLATLSVLKLGKVRSCWGSHYQYSFMRDEVNTPMKYINGLVELFGVGGGVGTIMSTYFA